MRGAGLFLFGIAASVPAAAQERSAAESDSACAAVLRTERLPGASCRALATAIVTRVTARFYAPDPRDVQNPGPHASLAGSAAQVEAVPGVQPVAVTGVSIAAVGTDSGARSVAAITLNPAVLFVAPGDAPAMAAASRIADVTLLVPLDDLDRDQDGRIDYVGARLRLNLTGAGSGRRVREAGEAFLRTVEGEAELVNRVIEALRRSSSVASCANSLLDGRATAGSIGRRCNGPVELALDPELYREMKERIVRARREADSRYLGLEVRADFGDPTLTGAIAGRTTALHGGVAFGRRLVPLDDGGTAVGVRGRAGARYTDLPGPAKASFGFDGGVGLEVVRPLNDDDMITVSSGLEFRYGGEENRDFTVFRFGLGVPIAGGADVAVALSLPLDGEVTSSFTVGLNWRMLLPGRGSP